MDEYAGRSQTSYLASSRHGVSATPPDSIPGYSLVDSKYTILVYLNCTTYHC
jgi:hypothetical protein